MRTKVPIRWVEGLPTSQSVDVYRSLAIRHALRGGQRGRLIADLINRDKLQEVCELDHDWALYQKLGYKAETVYNIVQAQAFFSKLKILTFAGVDPDAKGLEVFRTAESRCRETNQLLRAVREGNACFANRRVDGWLYEASQLIAQVLGPLPSLSSLGFRFGKGATTLTRKIEASIREKLNTSHAACSEELVSLSGELLYELPSLAYAWSMWGHDNGDELWCYVDVQIMDGQLSFVLKNWKARRGIVTEPPLNGLVQLATGDYITRRLRRFGVDLSDQTRNQRLAKLGSEKGKLATLDSTSASDTNAYELVFDLLPLDWAIFLARARTGHVLWNGSRIRLEKFSSMGNGYTFPLETLIFWALTCTVCGTRDPARVSVYGDDIICPSENFGDVVSCLSTVGFIPNEKKSYSTGPFRESCGKDYFEGFDIRPWFAKGPWSAFSLFKLHNFYVRRGMADDAAFVRGYLPDHHLLFGPDGKGDGHLIHPDWKDLQPTSNAERTRKLRSEKGYEGCVYSTYTLSTRSDAGPPGMGDDVLPLYLTDFYGREKVLSIRDFVRSELHRTDDQKSCDVRGLKGLSTLERVSFAGHMLRGFGDVSLPSNRVREVLRDDGSRVKAIDLPNVTEPDDDEVEDLDYYTQSNYTLD